MKLKLLFLLGIIILPFGVLHAQEHKDSAQTAAPSTVWSIGPFDISLRLNVLASDSLEGRRTGTAGAERAATYIAREFQKRFITPLDSGRTYFQNFDFSEHAIDTTKLGLTHGKNVVAFIRGADPVLRDEYVVIGAHYDHLGWGDRHFALDTVHAIHYGADDNASGTAGLLEIAEDMSASRFNLKRSVIFIAFSGEEEGLIGSGYFIDHPLVDKQKIVAMLNMDMIGRMKDSTLIVEGIGSSPEWKPLIESVELTKHFDLHMKATGRGPSDHEKFYAAGIPVLFFFTGFHHDYHRSTDTKEKINTFGTAKVAQFVEDIAVRIANEPGRPTFTKAPEDTSSKSTSFSVYVGGIPDYAYDGDGVKISEVTEHSPAERGGLKKDDVIVGFDGQNIKNIYDYTDALSKHKPDQQVDVIVLRSSLRVTVPVTLGRRASMH